MTSKEFKEAAKFTLKFGGGIYAFIGVLCNEVKMPYGDQEWEDLYQKLIKNDEK